MITNEYILTKAFYFYSKVLFLFMILFYIHSKGGLIINGRDLWICSGFQHRPERRTTDCWKRVQIWCERNFNFFQFSLANQSLLYWYVHIGTEIYELSHKNLICCTDMRWKRKNFWKMEAKPLICSLYGAREEKIFKKVIIYTFAVLIWCERRKK